MRNVCHTISTVLEAFPKRKLLVAVVVSFAGGCLLNVHPAAMLFDGEKLDVNGGFGSVTFGVTVKTQQ